MSTANLLDFHGPNAGYVLDLYERYRQDPASVDADTRAAFENGWTPPVDFLPETRTAADTSAAPASSSASAAAAPSQFTLAGEECDITKIVAAARLGRLVRELGHLEAKLDPLGSPPPGDPSLLLSSHGLTEDDMRALPPSVIGGPLARGAANALEALERLRMAYSGSVGYEDDHVQVAEERKWIRDAIEMRLFHLNFGPPEKRYLLERLTEVDTFEQFLHRTPPYQGQKRFSIEGCDMMVPMLDSIISGTARAGTREVVIGMAHRGRLNVLAHVLNKPYSVMLSEFPNPNSTESQPAVSGTGSQGYTGDVKYHKGYQRAYRADENGAQMPITLAPNPSHLEFVNPVVVGRARAAQEKRDHAGEPEQDTIAALAILIHGDAAFPGQGIVAETLNLSQLPGYCIGGTIHIIANNQIGFTTNPRDSRSTLYASDLAKGFEIPIAHVNADDPEACIAVARMAVAYRQRFGKDFLIDLVGYRRWGHNEGDEPAFTQPRMYENIRSHPRVRQVWAKQLVEEGIVTEAEAENLVESVQNRLMEARSKPAEPSASPPRADLNPLTPAPEEPEPPVAADTLKTLNAALHTFPEGFTPDTGLERRFIAPRRAALDDADPGIFWSHAESLAFASLLMEGTPIRMTGQDTERGTFTQRHLVFTDPSTGRRYTPLQNLPGTKASFVVHNSPLSENAVLGFEYGYSIHATDTLVLWEAQFGDFVNGAQVVIDQFLVSGNAKWQQTPGLVLLLPHGYEGQGPEHSSARIERFLEMCAGENIHVANCTTAAQYFHLLRRHAVQLKKDARPLVLFTPKSLLRHPRAASSLADLTDGGFQKVIDDPRDAARRGGVTRLVLCSGKVYVDLTYDAAARGTRAAYEQAANVAIARVEELYPFPAEELQRLLSGYANLLEVIWLQEEPKNMGAWSFMRPRLEELLPPGVGLCYIGREEAASPAEGSLRQHEFEQNRIVAAAFEDVPQPPQKAPSRSNSGRNGSNGSSNGSGSADSDKKTKTRKRTEVSSAHAR